MTNKKRLCGIILIGLIAILTALELSYPGTVSMRPGVRDIRVRWYAMRLNSDAPDIQRDAADALARMGTHAEPAVPALVEVLNSSDFEVRKRAARALGKIGPGAEAAIEPLIRSMKDWDGEWDGFPTAEHVILPAVQNPGLSTRAIEPSVYTILVFHGGEGIMNVPMALCEIGEPALEPLLAALQDENVRIRSGATLTMHVFLPVIDDPETRAKAVAPLIGMMRDRDMSARKCVPGALCKIGEPAVERLVQFVLEQEADQHPEGSVLAALVLCEILRSYDDTELERRVMEPLLTTLEAENMEVRARAGMAVETLLTAIKDPEIRAKALEKLSRHR